MDGAPQNGMAIHVHVTAATKEVDAKQKVFRKISNKKSKTF